MYQEDVDITLDQQRRRSDETQKSQTIRLYQEDVDMTFNQPRRSDETQKFQTMQVYSKTEIHAVRKPKTEGRK